MRYSYFPYTSYLDTISVGRLKASPGNELQHKCNFAVEAIENRQVLNDSLFFFTLVTTTVHDGSGCVHLRAYDRWTLITTCLGLGNERQNVHGRPPTPQKTIMALHPVPFGKETRMQSNRGSKET